MSLVRKPEALEDRITRLERNMAHDVRLLRDRIAELAAVNARQRELLRALAESTGHVSIFEPAPPPAPAPAACSRCSAPLAVGSFNQRACRTCDPARFEPCLKCRVERLSCCC